MEKIDIIREILEADVVSVSLPEDNGELLELSFKELKMDSLDVMVFFVALERRLNIAIPDSETCKMNNIGDVLAYLN